MATLSRKWISLAVLTGIAILSYTSAAILDDYDICDVQVIKAGTTFSSIYSNSAELNTANTCRMWRIEVNDGGSINIRIRQAYFNQTVCSSGSSLQLGPAPFFDICKSKYDLPIMYHSLRHYVWIKYIIGSRPWPQSSVDQFRIDYIWNEGPYCGFKCQDKTCIDHGWVCNGLNECSNGEDENEALCKQSTTAVKETDMPPHAVTSSNVVLLLPQNSVTLYGNASFDDHGIVSYFWNEKSKQSLSFHAQGVRTAFLHLTNLEQGEYIFTLIVTDTKGQSSSDEVHVLVKPGLSSAKSSIFRPSLSTTSSSLAPSRSVDVTTSPAPSSCFMCFQPLVYKYQCLPSKYLCDGISQCRFGEDELKANCNKRVQSSTPVPTKACAFNEIYCYVSTYRRYMCLHNMYKCNGASDCLHGEDEDPAMCGDNICNKRLEDETGWFASPNFPRYYPQDVHCSWVIHQRGTGSKTILQLRIVTFEVERKVGTDYVNVYDGPDDTYNLIGSYYGSNQPPKVIESTSDWLNIVFKSNYVDEYQGFNFTYQIKGVCLPTQRQCDGENDCYDFTQERCDGVWDCPHKGSDEIGCGHCSKGDYSCGLQTNQCYHASERCNGLARCSNAFDETNCSSDQCGTHNGTFLCRNNRCIYESWTCDQRDDCGDNSDEEFCAGTTKRVIIAAICGSMICALLLVILLGCSCKLYSVRNLDHHHRHIRHESPMSRMYAEFLRRRAPPPYHEAMLTSRNFEEVQQEYLERMRNSRQNRRNRRRSRNQQSQAATDNGDSNQNNAGQDVENTGAADESTTGMQLSTINEENETRDGVNNELDSSTAELVPSASDSDSSDIDYRESETDLAEHGQGHSEENADNDDDDDDDDDDENILTSTVLSSQWARTIDSDDSSDDVCILGDGSITPAPIELESQCQGHCDNGSIDTEVSASICSMDQHEIPSNSSMFKESDNENSENEEIENSRNSTPKPDSCHGNTVISETGVSRMRSSNSNGSLDSMESEG
ncbi:Low-density lipoprotein receptor-related protein 12 [Mactra antiquata]